MRDAGGLRSSTELTSILEVLCILTTQDGRHTGTMNEPLLIHLVDKSGRWADHLVRSAHVAGHLPRVYGTIDDLFCAGPEYGVVIACDDPARGGVASTLGKMTAANLWLPLVAISEQPSAARIVHAIKAGVFDYLTLPLQQEWLIATLRRIGAEAKAHVDMLRRMVDARSRIGGLSRRERQVLEGLAYGGSNKAIARDLAISPRTVEIYRANMLAKLRAANSAEAVRLHFEAQLEELTPKPV